MDVVVESANTIAIFTDQAESIGVAEILKLDAGARINFLHGLDKFIDKLVVGGTSLPFLQEAKVVWAFQQFLIVGAGIEHDRQTEFWGDPGAGGIE